MTKKLKPILDTKQLTEAFTEAGVSLGHIKKVQRCVLVHFQQNSELPVNFLKLGLPVKALNILTQNFAALTTRVIESQTSEDKSTTKLLIELQDGQRIETVIMRYGDVDLRSFPEKEKLKLEKRWEEIISSDTASILSTDSAATRKFRSNQRATVCVSSQVGCAQGCKFCATGTMGLIRNLTAGEILEQVIHASIAYGSRIKNLVFMGMGELLANYEACRYSVDALCDAQLFNMSPMRISVSTVGLVPAIKRMTQDMPLVSLALSLHAPTQELREKIVPTAKAYPIDKILDATYEFIYNQNVVLNDRAHSENYARILGRNARLLKKGGDASSIVSIDSQIVGETKINHNRRKILMEYVLLGPDVNCTADVAHQLGQLLTLPPKGYEQEEAPEELLIVNNVHLNLIPYNPTIAGIVHKYEPPSQDIIDEFAFIVRSYGVTVMVRQELGQDIDAACGQLVVKSRDIEDLSLQQSSHPNTLQRKNRIKRRRNSHQSVKKEDLKTVSGSKFGRNLEALVIVALLVIALRLAIKMVIEKAQLIN